MSDIESFVKYIETRLGLNGKDDPRYWKRHPPVPDWLPDTELWNRTKKNLLRSEIAKLKDKLDENRDPANSEWLQFEARFREIEKVGEELDGSDQGEVVSAPSSNQLHGPQSPTMVVAARGAPALQMTEGVAQDKDLKDGADYEGLSEAVQNVWAKASQWTSMLRSDNTKLTSVSTTQNQNVDETESALRQAKNQSRAENLSWLLTLGQMAIAVMYTFITLMLILLGLKP